MQSAASQPSFEARLLVGVGFALWLLAALAAVWEVLALQPPDSPLHLGILSGPIAQLSALAFALGTVAASVGLLWPMLYVAGEGRVVAWLLVVGAALHVLALLLAASRGLLAVQLLDPRPDARFLLYGRGFALSLTFAALCALLTRAMRRI
ncbi:MAG: hypothetical protein JWN04_298 [Myxococcaceae bacterium]|nr:hypothetical protein [Myxococcaceae bacterium]